MEKLRAVKSRLSYKNATIVVCLINIAALLLLLHHGFFYSSSPKLSTSDKGPNFEFRRHKLSNEHNVNVILGSLDLDFHVLALYRHIQESEGIRRAMIPHDLIKRVREIGDAYVETAQVVQKDVKQGAAVDLISRLNNFRSYSDAGSNKALAEWRKRKMERARQRSLP